MEIEINKKHTEFIDNNKFKKKHITDFNNENNN